MHWIIILLLSIWALLIFQLVYSHYCNKRRKLLNDEEDYVIVRVWTSKCNPSRPGASFGHVSLELRIKRKQGTYANDSYISIGPGGPLTFTDDIFPHNTLSPHPPKYVKNYEDDVEGEKRPPEFVFVLHSLSARTIQTEFQKVKTEKKTCWALCGNLSFGTATKEKGDFLKQIMTSVISTLLMVLQIIDFRLASLTTYKYIKNVEPSSAFNAAMKDQNCVSCVLLVNQLLTAGCLGKLLNVVDKTKSAINSSNLASGQSYKAITDGDFIKALKAFGYLFEHGVSTVILSPDVFADLMMYAKTNELKMFNVPAGNNNIVDKEWLPPPTNILGGFHGYFLLTISIAIAIYNVVSYY